MQNPSSIAIIGAGPAGLMAAESLAGAGHKVTVYEHKRSPGRKFLMAGRGGLNLTHSENLETFLTRYGTAAGRLAPVIENFPPAQLQAWCEELGQPTFVGSSGRIFPKSLKASPLLRAWLARLDGLSVSFKMQYRWTGWNAQGALIFTGPDGAEEHVKVDAALLALGGASWPGLGSDGAWTDILQAEHIDIAPLLPANCGFTVAWSDMFREKFAGQPLKNIALAFAGKTVPGEMMISQNGIEGGAVYALSSDIRTAVLDKGEAVIHIDLRPNLTAEQVLQKLKIPRKRHSFSNQIKKALNLSPLAVNLLREADRTVPERTPAELSKLVKAVPVRVAAPFPLDRAISSAGGVKLNAINDDFMLKNKPGIFIAGEMLDWEAPTGGYLLQASFATAHAAAHGMLKWLARP